MRARNIKPAFFINEDLADLDVKARLLFIGLWCYADREGLFEWRPKRIKAAIFPYDNFDVEKLLMSLHAMSLIVMYSQDGHDYGIIPTFKDHQNPHPHEKKSVLPKPEQNQCHEMSLHVSEMSTKCNADIIIPDTINNKEGSKFSAKSFLLEYCQNEQLINDWLKVRKEKRLPPTETAMNLFIKKVEKSKFNCEKILEICCDKGWAGFEIEWLDKIPHLQAVNDTRGLL